MAARYFNDLFRISSPTEFDEFLDEVPSRVTEAQNLRLLAPVTEEEVKRALFMMSPEKAPGPDGMTTLFLSAVLVNN